jgi:hypothetical protein
MAKIFLTDITVPMVDVTTYGAGYPDYVQGSAAEVRGTIVLANGTSMAAIAHMTLEEQHQLSDLLDRIGRRVLTENGLA